MTTANHGSAVFVFAPQSWCLHDDFLNQSLDDVKPAQISCPANGNREVCLDAMNSALEGGKNSLLSASCIFITLGTAWVFRHREVSLRSGFDERIPVGT